MLNLNESVRRFVGGRILEMIVNSRLAAKRNSIQWIFCVCIFLSIAMKIVFMGIGFYYEIVGIVAALKQRLVVCLLGPRLQDLRGPLDSLGLLDFPGFLDPLDPLDPQDLQDLQDQRAAQRFV